MTTQTHIARSAWGALAALSLAATACGPTIPPPKPLPPPPPPSAVEQAVAAAEEAPGVSYIYSPIGKRDPFRDMVSGATKLVVGPDPSKRGKLTALQKFEIDQLKLQFSVTGTSSPLAMVIDPNGKGHTVRIGDFVGKNWGKVSHIGREEITITETIADQQTGRVYPVYIPMRMPKTDAEKAAEKAIDDAPGSPL